MENIVLVTHNDLDGAGCAIVFNIVTRMRPSIFKNKVSIIHCSNGNVDANIQKAIDNGLICDNTFLCFGDICPGEEMASKLVDLVKEPINVWDHHVSNSYISDYIKTAKIITEIIPERQESGTSLMFTFFATKILSIFKDDIDIDLLKTLIENIRSYDTYEWKKTNNKVAERLNTLFSLMTIEDFVSKYTKRILGDKTDIMDEPIPSNDDSLLFESSDNIFIDSYLTKQQAAIDSLTLNDMYQMKIEGYNAVIHIADGFNVSETGNQFLLKHPEVDIYIGYLAKANEYGLRTVRDDIDLSKIAKALGGGGHQKAAGSPVSSDLKSDIYKIIAESITSSYWCGQS